MAGHAYQQNTIIHPHYLPVDPQLDIFDDSFSTFFDFHGYMPDGFQPAHPDLINDNDKPHPYHAITQSVETNQYAPGGTPSTPSPPRPAQTAFFQTPPTSSSDYNENSASVSPPPAKRRATRVKQEPVTPKKNKPEVERRELPAVSPNGLRFSNATDAELFGLRTKVSLPGDDWETMAADPESWVKQIMAAFNKPPISEAKRHRKDGKTIAPAQWATFQNNHVEKTNNHIIKNPSMVEIGAWQVFRAIVDAHKLGYLDYKAESTKICSVHMNEAIQAISDYAVIRFDVVRCMGIENLASSVGATVMRKLNCLNGNAAKKEREEQNAKMAAEKGQDWYKNVLGSGQKSNGGKGKRKRNQDHE